MTTKKRVFVLVGDEQTPLSPSDVAVSVSMVGFDGTSKRFGYSETALRAFLMGNGYVAKRVVSYKKGGEVLVTPATPAERVVPVGG